MDEVAFFSFTVNNDNDEGGEDDDDDEGDDDDDDNGECFAVNLDVEASDGAASSTMSS